MLCFALPSLFASLWVKHTLVTSKAESMLVEACGEEGDECNGCYAYGFVEQVRHVLRILDL